MKNQLVRRSAVVWVLVGLMLGLAACGGVKDTSVPPPPGATEIRTGDNAGIDTFMTIIKPALEQELTKAGGQLNQEAYYTTASGVTDVAKFYSDEMKKRGWKETTNQTDPNGTILTYDSGKNGVLVFITDGAVLNADGTFVMTINASEK